MAFGRRLFYFPFLFPKARCAGNRCLGFVVDIREQQSYSYHCFLMISFSEKKKIELMLKMVSRDRT
jgi:hypothetical protein